MEKPLSGKTAEEEKPLSVISFIGITIVLLAIYLLFSNTLGTDFLPEITSSMGYGVLFVVGLLTSLHCVAMCGGISMSQCAAAHTTAANAKSNMRQNLFYNLGRVISYTVIGGLVGGIGTVIQLSGSARGLIPVISGILMVIMGLSMTGLFPKLQKFIPRFPQNFRTKADAAKRSKGPFLVGLLNGMMPCGLLQAMQAYALGTGSAAADALSMIFFSLGTIPLMFGFGVMITMLGQKFKKKMMQVSAVLVAALGVIMLSRGFALSGIALPAIRATNSSAAELSADAEVSVVHGVQNVTSTLTAYGYPDITVQAGIPVVWNLQADADVLNGCNGTLIIPAYNVEAKLELGDNIIKFIPTKSGAIHYSRWMGMITAQIQVVNDLDGKTA